MSISKNYVSLIGFVGQQPELRQTKKSNKDVTSFGIALNESWTDKRGKKMEETTWVKIRAWNRLAEIAAEYLDKGSLIEVEGKIVKAEAWENADGELEAQTVVQARTIRFLDRTPRTEDDEERSTSRSTKRSTTKRSTTKRSTTKRSATSRTTSSTRRSATTKQRTGSSILDELSDEEVAELRKALLKQQVKKVEDVTEYEDEDDHMEDGDEVEEVTPARQPRQGKTSKVPFSKRSKSA
jgi:single-strand DNA-binding protein